MENVYIALDFPDWETTKAFIEDNKLQGAPVKVGMELYYQEGPKIIEKLKENNHSIFLDLKLHDIPTTVKRTMKNLAKLGVDIVNVHALGGKEMIKQAKEGLLSGQKEGEETKLLAVTLLTSHDNDVMKNELLLPGDLNQNVVHFSKLAKESGADGVVCSVHEANDIKAVCGSDFLTVTPGIRLMENDEDDQKRIASPLVASKSGADILVIGRSITQAIDPIKAYNQATEEFNHDTK